MSRPNENYLKEKSLTRGRGGVIEKFYQVRDDRSKLYLFWEIHYTFLGEGPLPFYDLLSSLLVAQLLIKSCDAETWRREKRDRLKGENKLKTWIEVSWKMNK